jgi:hypothetical protein
MSGISHLYDIYNKKGKDFVENLFNSYVTVNEKMDGSAFMFERDVETGKFIFYKRDQRNPITMVDRTLMKYYEKPILYIESLPIHIIKEIPRGWKFGLEYFSNPNPVEIAYDRIPKNNLILSYVKPKEDSDSEQITDKKKLDVWANLIGVEIPPIIFQGILSAEQKSMILDFLRTPFDKLVNEYKTKSFVRFMLGVLNPEIKSSALNNDLDKPIEGIVFRFSSDSNNKGEVILSKMVDPVFTEIAKSRSSKKSEEIPSDFLGITILDVMNFILDRGIENFKVKGDSEDKRYISFISDVFSKFLEEYGYKYKGANFQEPDYLKKEEFRLNRDMIADPRVMKWIEDDDSYESLFKLILNSFRKIKKRTDGIITPGIIDQFNMLVSNIDTAVRKKKYIKANESNIPSFLDFKKNNIDPVNLDHLTLEGDEADENFDDHFYSYNDFITALETIDSVDKPKVDTKPIDDKSVKDNSKAKKGDPQKVNLIVGRFQPFHNGHMKMVDVLRDKNELPSIVAVVHSGNDKSEDSPFDLNLVSKYMESLIMEFPQRIQGYFIVNKGLLGPICSRAKELGYLPVSIGSGEDKSDDYNKQLDFLKKIGSDFHESMELIETPRKNSGSEIRDYLDKEDFLAFKKSVPQSISSFYQQMVSSKKGRQITESLITEKLEKK